MFFLMGLYTANHNTYEDGGFVAVTKESRRVDKKATAPADWQGTAVLQVTSQPLAGQRHATPRLS